MSLWALAASPLILGTDLTHLDPTDLGYLTNRAVLVGGPGQHRRGPGRWTAPAAQVFAKTEKSGDVVAGLFNTGSQPEVIRTTAAAVGLPASTTYLLNDLWHHRLTESGSTIEADVPRTRGRALPDPADSRGGRRQAWCRRTRRWPSLGWPR